MNLLLKNPFTAWMKWVVDTVVLLMGNRGKCLRLGYFARAKQSRFGSFCALQDHAYLYNVELGDFSYVSTRAQIAHTKIGKFCSIGPDVKIGLGRHPAADFVSSHPVFFSTRGQSPAVFADRDYFEECLPVEIGNDVWIGERAMVTDGVRIGNGAIIAAGAVVTKDVEPYSIVGGVPAKAIKWRFEEDDRGYLLKLKWWDRDPAWLKQNFRSFHHIDAFKKVTS